jgi:hypothetical protein
MLLKCVAEVGADLGPYEKGLFYTPETRFDLSRGNLYRTYGLMMYNGALVALTTDDYGDPTWTPLQAFTVEDPSLPGGWLFQYFPPERDGLPDKPQVQAIWGYRELADDLAHNNALMDRDPAAMAIFASEVKRTKGGENP